MKDKYQDKSLDEIIKESKKHKIGKKKGSPWAGKHKEAEVDNLKRENGKPKAKNNETEFSVLVFNIPSSIKHEELVVLFSQFGQIEKLNTYWIPSLKENFNVKAFYGRKEESQKAFETLNGAELDKRFLKAKLNA